MTVPAFPLEATPYALPLAAQFRGLSQREGVVIRGPGGWGEFAPFSDYSADQDARWLVAAIESAVDPDPGDGAPVAANAILPEWPDHHLARGVRDVVRATGCSTVKLKVGGRPTAAELARVRSVHRAASDVVADVRLRLDGNGRFGMSEAQELLAALTWSDLPVEYVEQPCDSVAEMRLLKQQFPAVPLAVDEALRRDRRFDDLAAAADVAILKVGPLGGARTVRELAAQLDLPVVISGAAESSVGLSRDAVVAAAVGAADRAHGLGTGTLLADDLTAQRLLPSGGVVPARRMPADEASLARAASRVSPAGRRSWRERLDAAWRFAWLSGLLAADDLVELGVRA